MNKTKIEWCDYTWNPITGCSPVSEGCEHCYAAGISKRFGLPWGEPVFNKDRLEDPLKLKKPARIFVGSMTDMLHPLIELHHAGLVFDVIQKCPQHTFMLLTKRPAGMLPADIADMPNLWMGVTAENQARADERIPMLLEIPAAVRFVSLEPMLGPVDLSKWNGLDWVIAGPETGTGARQCDSAWIFDVAAECAIAGVPFFDKRKRGWLRREWPKDRQP